MSQVAQHRRQLVTKAESREAELQAQLDATAAQIAQLQGHRIHAHQVAHLKHVAQLHSRELADLRAQVLITQFDKAVAVLYDQLNSAAAADEENIISFFWAAVEKRSPTVTLTTKDECIKCGVAMCLTVESQMACPQCGLAVTYLDATSNSMAYGDGVEFTQYHYRRESHFKDNLKALQAKRVIHIPKTTLAVILQELQVMYGVSGPQQIEVHMVRPVLKRLEQQEQATKRHGVDFHALYDYSMLIYTLISGKPVPNFTPEQEANIVMLFQAIQPLFDKHRPEGRQNFINYTLCIFKFCQRLGYLDALPFLTLLKCSEKLRMQNEIMKRIFDELGWAWMPTPTDRQSTNKARRTTAASTARGAAAGSSVEPPTPAQRA